MRGVEARRVRPYRRKIRRNSHSVRKFLSRNSGRCARIHGVVASMNLYEYDDATLSAGLMEIRAELRELEASKYSLNSVEYGERKRELRRQKSLITAELNRRRLERQLPLF